jgi:hypothetical protein
VKPGAGGSADDNGGDDEDARITTLPPLAVARVATLPLLLLRVGVLAGDELLRAVLLLLLLLLLTSLLVVLTFWEEETLNRFRFFKDDDDDVAWLQLVARRRRRRGSTREGAVMRDADDIVRARRGVCGGAMRKGLLLPSSQVWRVAWCIAAEMRQVSKTWVTFCFQPRHVFLSSQHEPRGFTKTSTPPKFSPLTQEAAETHPALTTHQPPRVSTPTRQQRPLSFFLEKETR